MCNCWSLKKIAVAKIPAKIFNTNSNKETKIKVFVKIQVTKRRKWWKVSWIKLVFNLFLFIFDCNMGCELLTTKISFISNSINEVVLRLTWVWHTFSIGFLAKNSTTWISFVTKSWEASRKKFTFSQIPPQLQSLHLNLPQHFCTLSQHSFYVRLFPILNFY